MRLVPCRQSALICSQAQELSGSAEEFCKAAGYLVQEHQPCFDGSVPRVMDSCQRSSSLSHKRRQSREQQLKDESFVLKAVIKYFPLWGGALTLLIGLMLLRRSKTLPVGHLSSSRFPGQGRRLQD